MSVKPFFLQFACLLLALLVSAPAWGVTTISISAANLPVGGSANGDIASVCEEDWYQFRAATAGVYTMWTQLDTLPDSTLTLLDNDFVIIDFNDDDPTLSPASRLSATLTPGTYYIKVGSAACVVALREQLRVQSAPDNISSGTGTYTLYLTGPGTSPPNTSSSTTSVAPTTSVRTTSIRTTSTSSTSTTTTIAGLIPLPVGGWAQGNVEEPGQVNWFGFTAPADGVYTMWTDFQTLPDSIMYLYRQNSPLTLIAENDDCGTQCAGRDPLSSYISATLEAGSYYVVKVRGYRFNQVGTFRMYLEGPGGGGTTTTTAGPSGVTPIAVGGSAAGEIVEAGGEDWYQFTASTAGTYTMWTDLGTIRDTQLYLYGPGSQTALITWNDDCGAYCGGRHVWSSYLARSLSPGTYYIKVKGYGNAAGTYTLYLTGPGGESTTTTSTSDIIELPVGGSAGGHVVSAGDFNWFRFTAENAGAYAMWTELGTLGDTVMYLYGPESQTTLITWNDDQGGTGPARLASRIERTLTPGVYYLKVAGYGSTTGMYTTYLTGPGAGETTTTTTASDITPIAVGGSAGGDLTPAGDEDWFTFTAAASGTYAMWTDLGTLPDSVLGIYGPGGQTTLIAWNDDCGVNCAGRSRYSSYMSGTLAPGVYYLKVTGYDQATGTYTLYLTGPGATSTTTSSPGPTTTSAPSGGGFTSTWDDLGMQGWAGRIGSWTTVAGGYLYSAHSTEYTYSAYYYPSSFSDFSYEAVVKRGAAAVNSANRILIRGNHSTISTGGHWRDYYSFQYSNEGKFSVWKRINGVATALQSWSVSAAIRAGDWNTLKVQASGTDLSFWINGTLVWSGHDASLSSGYVGVGYYGSLGGGFWVDSASLVPGSSAATAWWGADREVVPSAQAARNEDADRNPRGTEDHSE